MAQSPSSWVKLQSTQSIQNKLPLTSKRSFICVHFHSFQNLCTKRTENLPNTLRFLMFSIHSSYWLDLKWFSEFLISYSSFSRSSIPYLHSPLGNEEYYTIPDLRNHGYPDRITILIPFLPCRKNEPFQDPSPLFLILQRKPPPLPQILKSNSPSISSSAPVDLPPPQ